MSIINRYLWKEIITLLLRGILITSLILSVINYVEYSLYFNTVDTFAIALYSTVGYLYDAFGIIIVVSASQKIGELSRNNEYLALQTLGVNNKKIVVQFIYIAITVSLVVVLVLSPLSRYCQSKIMNYYDSLYDGEQHMINFKFNSGNHEYIFNVEHMEHNNIKDISLVIINDGEYYQRMNAKSASISKGILSLYDVDIYHNNGEFIKQERYDIDIPYEKIDYLLNSKAYSVVERYKYAWVAKELGHDWSQVVIDVYADMSLFLNYIALYLMVLIFNLKLSARNVNYIYGVTICVILSILHFYFNKMFLYYGVVNMFPYYIAGISANVLTSMVIFGITVNKLLYR